MIADRNISMLQNLALLCNLCERVLNRHLDELGLTATQAKVLGYLFSQADEHNVNQRDIENAFFLTNPTVTGTHFAHVEVDTWTGLTRVLDYLAVHDV